jgi:hypothetical protein
MRSGPNRSPRKRSDAKVVGLSRSDFGASAEIEGADFCGGAHDEPEGGSAEQDDDGVEAADHPFEDGEAGFDPGEAVVEIGDFLGGSLSGFIGNPSFFEGRVSFHQRDGHRREALPWLWAWPGSSTISKSQVFIPLSGRRPERRNIHSCLLEGGEGGGGFVYATAG